MLARPSRPLSILLAIPILAGLGTWSAEAVTETGEEGSPSVAPHASSESLDGAMPPGTLPSPPPQTPRAAPPEAQRSAAQKRTQSVVPGGSRGLTLGSTTTTPPCPGATGVNVTCTTITPSTQEAIKALRNSGAPVQSSAITAQALTPSAEPQYCFDYANRGVWGVRENSCEVFSVSVQFFQFQPPSTYILSGTLAATAISYNYMVPTLNGSIHQLRTFVNTRSGVATSAVVVPGSATCSGGCTGVTSEWSGTSTAPGSSSIGILGFQADPNMPNGAVYRFYSNWTWNYSAPGYSTGPAVGTAYHLTRCDKAAITSIGCVWPDQDPWFYLALAAGGSSDVSEVARHVQRAQASGLRQTLTRTQDSALVTRNRSTACPIGEPRPRGYTCDEYPFASSREGGASGGSVRTFDGCQTTGTIGATGEVGYSRCMVVRTQNSRAGAFLGDFYAKYRVIEGDRFAVKLY